MWNYGNPWMMNNGYYGGMGGFGFLGFLFMILWWAFIIALVIAAIKWLTRGSRGSRSTGEKSPMEILKERYARGEITKDEYQEIRKELEK